MKNQKSRRMKKSKVQPIVRGPGVLPMIDANPTYNQTFRYYASTTSNNLIFSRADILNVLQMALSTGTSSTSGARIFFAAKVNWIRVYVSPSSTSTPETCNLTWEGMYGKHTVVSATTLGVSTASEFLTKPPRDSEAGFYSLSGSQETQPLFNMDISQYSVLDINLSFTLQNLIDNSSGATITSSTKTVGQGIIYTAALDGTSTNVMVPVGRQQW